MVAEAMEGSVTETRLSASGEFSTRDFPANTRNVSPGAP